MSDTIKTNGPPLNSGVASDYYDGAGEWIGHSIRHRARGRDYWIGFLYICDGNTFSGGTWRFVGEEKVIRDQFQEHVRLALREASWPH